MIKAVILSDIFKIKFFKMLRVFHLAALVLVLSLGGCIIKVKSQEDIIGTWASDNSAELHFLDDGTFQGRKLPAMYFWNHEFGEIVFNGEGRWEMSNQEGAAVILKFNTSSLPTLQKGFQTEILFDKYDGKPHLYQWKEEGVDRYEFTRMAAPGKVAH